MSFLSYQFVILFLILLIILKVAGNSIQKYNWILLVASYIFYALGSKIFVILLFLISVLTWWVGVRISDALDEKSKKKWLVLGVTVNILVLCVFKYFNFFADQFGKIFHMNNAIVHIIMPVGISFYIFQSLSYMFDAYNSKIEVQRSLSLILLYIGFFPQIVAGPIMKAHDFLPQLEQKHTISKRNLSWGIQRIMLGLFKKTVIADRLSVCVDAVYSAPAAYSGFSILMAVLSYSLQIYYDFSGYSDMAIGIARILGFDYGTNFNLPYLAKNPSDFWKRWHISLSTWFKEYVYIPLGGNRKGKAKTYINLFVTMCLSGIWHGASISFALWGALHGLNSVIHKAFKDIVKPSNDSRLLTRILSCVVNYIVVTLLWIPFRTENMGDTLLILKRILTCSEGISYIYVFTPIFVLLLIIIEIISVRTNHGNDIWKPLDLSKFYSKVIFIAFILIIAVFAYIGNNAFIYAHF